MAVTITDHSQGPHHLRLLASFPGETTERLFACFTEPRLLTRWWPPVVSVGPTEGAPYRYSWPEQQWHLHGTIKDLRPTILLTFTWNWEHEPDLPERVVECWFEQSQDAGRVVLTHGTYGDSEAEQRDRDGHRSGWEFFLGRLATAIEEGGPPAGFNPDELFRMLEGFPRALEALLLPLPEQSLTWRPPDGGWSLIEIVGHLLDEEELDFRPRLFSTLEDPARPWPPINPPETVQQRNHQAASLDELLSQFECERRTSLSALHARVLPDWSNTHEHPRIGPISATDLLVSWAAHDALHLRQIGKRLYELAVVCGGGVGRAEYAGVIN